MREEGAREATSGEVGTGHLGLEWWAAVVRCGL